jgi:Zn-dependent M32 family carboxypeptidase
MGSIESVSWLEGNWVSDKSNSSSMLTKEQWKLDNQEMKGIGLVIKNSDTSYVENLSIRMINDTLSYVAEVPENEEKTIFKLTSYKKDTWKFENPAHDFPKSIEYVKKKGGFEAVVSGGDRSFKLNFKRD